MSKKAILRRIAFILAPLLLISACAPHIPKAALQLSKESLKNRQLQTRRFNTDEETLLSASAAVLQDLGFNIDESETKLGVIVCSKKRSAMSAGQIVGSIFLALLTGDGIFIDNIDKEQLIRASLITNPIIINKSDKTKCQTAVRITFQRIVTDINGRINRLECINEPKIYQGFFDKLSKSLFLEANQI